MSDALIKKGGNEGVGKNDDRTESEGIADLMELKHVKEGG